MPWQRHGAAVLWSSILRGHVHPGDPPHFAELLPVFQEAHRVLERGRFVILTATPVQMQSYWLNEYFPDAMLKSIE